MKPTTARSLVLLFATILIAASACNMRNEATPPPPTPEQALLIPVAGPLATSTIPPALTPTITSTGPVVHAMTPANPRGGKLIYDVDSAGTAPEKRAPYGDSYDINRLERPFTQDMSYISGLDISTFTVSKDNDWWYVEIELVGINPGNMPEINYGVEMDLDRDGFGDYLIWAHPPYTDQWDTAPVQIYQDQSHNTGGVSAGKSDAPFPTDGYETLIFDGVAGGEDPDLAWIRLEAGTPAIVQFAFKRSWSGNVFMLGVIADAGWRDPQKLDYVDRFPIEEAGSPVKENKNYPLKSLFLVDNTCREAFGFEPSSYEPQLCPVLVPPSKTPGPSLPSSSDPGNPQACQPPVAMKCPNGWDAVHCRCH